MQATNSTASAEPGADRAGPGPAPFAADRTLELPMRLLGRTVKRTADALAGLQPGQVLSLVTDDP